MIGVMISISYLCSDSNPKGVTSGGIYKKPKKNIDINDFAAILTGTSRLQSVFMPCRCRAGGDPVSMQER